MCEYRGFGVCYNHTQTPCEAFGSSRHDFWQEVSGLLLEPKHFRELGSYRVLVATKPQPDNTCLKAIRRALHAIFILFFRQLHSEEKHTPAQEFPKPRIPFSYKAASCFRQYVRVVCRQKLVQPCRDPVPESSSKKGILKFVLNETFYMWLLLSTGDTAFQNCENYSSKWSCIVLVCNG